MEKMTIRVLFGLGILSYGCCFFSHIYCGPVDCYKRLGVGRRATMAELKNAYMTLQAKFKDQGTEVTKVQNAFLILSDNDMRKHYDYMLANPNRILYNYYQYFKFSVSPSITLQVSLVFGIIIISFAQYFYKNQSYWNALRDALKNPKNRSKALLHVQEQYLLFETTKKMKNKEKKEQRKRDEERALRQIVLKSIKYRRPRFQDTLFIQLLFSPYFFLQHMKRVVDQLARFDFFKEEYEDFAMYKKSVGVKVEPWTNSSKDGAFAECEDSQTKTNAWLNSH